MTLWNELNWSYQKLTDDDVQKQLAKLEIQSKYQKVYLSVNELQRVPALNKYPQFSNTHRLWLEGNYIRELKVSNIPRNVTILNLNRNAIREIPDMSNMNVQELFLSNNKIRSLNPQHLPVCLTELRLCDNDIEEVPDLSFLNLCELHLSKNSIKNIKVKHLPVTLVTLVLDNNNISYLENLDHLTVLKTLKLHQNNILFIQGLPTGLQEVSLARNPLMELAPGCFTSKSLYKTIKRRPDTFYMKDKGLTDEQVSELKSPPPEVFRGGYDVVLQYFKDLLLMKPRANSTRSTGMMSVADHVMKPFSDSHETLSAFSRGSPGISCHSGLNKKYHHGVTLSLNDLDHNSMNDDWRSLSIFMSLDDLDRKDNYFKNSQFLFHGKDCDEDSNDTWPQKWWQMCFCGKVKTNHLRNVFKRIGISRNDSTSMVPEAEVLSPKHQSNGQNATQRKEME